MNTKQKEQYLHERLNRLTGLICTLDLWHMTEDTVDLIIACMRSGILEEAFRNIQNLERFLWDQE